jgi:hypothetical protein
MQDFSYLINLFEMTIKRVARSRYQGSRFKKDPRSNSSGSRDWGPVLGWVLRNIGLENVQ